MDILKWRESYETGVVQMDEQHKRLIQLVNQMYGIIRDKKGFESLDEILKEMSEYAEQHLRDEEALLEKYGYPELNSQKKSHQEYLVKIDDLLFSVKADKNSGAQELYIFLRHWWIAHIVGEDVKYGSFLREKGVH